MFLTPNRTERDIDTLPQKVHHQVKFLEKNTKEEEATAEKDVKIQEEEVGIENIDIEAEVEAEAEVIEESIKEEVIDQGQVALPLLPLQVVLEVNQVRLKLRLLILNLERINGVQ